MHKHIFTLGLISASLCTMTAMAEALPSFNCSDVWMDNKLATPAKMFCADCCYNPAEADGGIKCLTLGLTRNYGNCWLPAGDYFDEYKQKFTHSCSIPGTINADGEMFCDSTIRFSRAKNGTCDETGYKVSWISNTAFLDPSVGIDNSGDHISYIGFHYDGNPNAIGNFTQFNPSAQTPYGMDETFGGQWILNFTGVSGTVNAKMYGTSACTPGATLPGEFLTVEKNITHDGESGVHCWCNVTKVGDTPTDNKLAKPWTYITSFTDPRDCDALCARTCATGYADKGVRGNAIRRALFKAWWENNK